jgi:predicted amidohydrolase YtcJ
MTPHVLAADLLLVNGRVLTMDAPDAVPGRWIIARGSPLADCRLAERRLPMRAELDAPAPLNPTYISFDAHVVIANTLALRERGITGDSPDR